MMIFFSKIFLGLYKYPRNTVKKIWFEKKIVLFCEKKLTIYNKQEFLATRSIPFELKKKFTFKNLRPGHLGSNNYY